MSLFSVIVPVYRNEENIPALLPRLAAVCRGMGTEWEVVFVVDGSPDGSEHALRKELASQPFSSQLVVLSRNFGSFNAIRAGLKAARGDYFGVIAADLQEPPELLPKFAEALQSGECDVCVGRRTSRQDGLANRCTSGVFWAVYRAIVQPQMPAGGLDVFGCTREVRNVLVSLREANSSLVGQLIWLGFRRAEIPYARAPRELGRSGWTFRKKWKYMADSIYSFTDLPIRALTFVGLLGTAVVCVATVVILVVWLTGTVGVPGYTPIMLAILFTGFTNFVGLGVVGNYVWRSFENSKLRPLHIVKSQERYPAGKGES